ncbi:Tn3 family transposase [Streptomyces sp. NPDC018057]|uniref:Tn3 family transposase n=1 Tax=unclassified Streptomyces TaxID=2593676 RepID=UPI0037B2608E
MEVGLCEAGETDGFDARFFRRRLENRLRSAAAAADAGYPDNEGLVIDPGMGTPSLKPHRSEGLTPSARRLEQEIKARMPERTLDISQAWGDGTAVAADGTHMDTCLDIIEGLLKNTSEVQPTTVHADTQGQSQPVFALAHLLGFDLMPRIRNWKGMTFYRPSKQREYVHTDALFGEPGKKSIDFDLIESRFRHLMRVAVSVREGAISSSTLLKRLRSGSKKNATYAAFREVGHVIRTVQLLRHLSDAPLRRRVTAATNKVEAFNGVSQWLGFGNRGVIADTDPVEQEKAMRFNALLTNAVIFHNALDIAEIVRQLLEEGWEITPEDLARISPYLTEHINRFGEYSTHELGIQPDAYGPKLDVDFTPLRDQGSAAVGFGQAA